MMLYRKFLIIYILIIILSFALVKPALAARELEVPIPIPGGGQITTLPALPDYIAAIFQFSLMVIGVICLVAFIYAGFSYVASVGSPSAMNDAKDRIFSALLGLIILFSAWLILNTINPELVILGEPAPGAVCTKDADCAAGEFCTGGSCTNYYIVTKGTKCTVDADCSPGQHCSGGYCKEGWAACSTYSSQTDCSNNPKCKWCPGCQGDLANVTVSIPLFYIGASYCIDPTKIPGGVCKYQSVPGFCGKT